jgi:hypothetical protein
MRVNSLQPFVVVVYLSHIELIILTRPGALLLVHSICSFSLKLGFSIGRSVRQSVATSVATNYLHYIL